MNEANEKYLSMMYEGYKQNVEGITQAISRLEEQLEEAVEARFEMQKSVTELQELLGIDPEAEVEEEAEEAEESGE